MIFDDFLPQKAGEKQEGANDVDVNSSDLIGGILLLF
jgi:hypothetical protein